MVKIIPMDRQTADIISRWDFGAGYEFYNIDEDPYVIETFLNGHYYSVFQEDMLIGFFCDGDSARMNDDYVLNSAIIDIGFALNPIFIGKGHGKAFIQLILDYYTGYATYRLTVAIFNRRAIHLYMKMGFKIVSVFTEIIDDAEVEFYVMQLNNPSLDR